MSTVEHLLPIGQGKTRSLQQYLLDTVVAFVGTMLVTGFIAVFQLYPRIPNISIVYLLVVLALASTRGRYASILASLVAFLSFDFFLVPQLRGRNVITHLPPGNLLLVEVDYLQIDQVLTNILENAVRYT